MQQNTRTELSVEEAVAEAEEKVHRRAEASKHYQIAKQLVDILSSRRNRSFDRELVIDFDLTDSLRVTETKVYISPFFFVTGNPAENIAHVLDVCEEFDERKRVASVRIADSLRHNLRVSLRNLLAVDPEAAFQIMEEECGVGEVTIEHVRLR